MHKFLPVLFCSLGIVLLALGCSSPNSSLEPTATTQALVTESVRAVPTATLPLQDVDTDPNQAPVAQDACVACHSNQQRLTEAAEPREDTESESKGVGWGSVAALQPWEKYMVDIEAFSRDVHGQKSCMECHGGTQSEDKDTAHQGLIHRPSEGENSVCKDCHPNVHQHYVNSLHYTQQGFFTTMYARTVPENHEALQQVFDNHCAKCHTTCGDCHVSTPISAGGGLFEGHLFKRTPPMTRSCTACHGTRVGDEYMGKHESIPGDIHFRQGQMNCIHCHSGSSLHGDPAQCTSCHPGSKDTAELPPPDHRYAGFQSPSCESCHAASLTGPDAPQMHLQHGTKLSCQVCHSVSYTSCDGCHVAISEKTGNPFFETQGTYLTFFIGRNPNPSFIRPYEYVPVRHIPIAPTSYQFYGANLLPNFNALPTWAYATPHNIQRLTPQATTCNSCHGNPEIFLTVDKVKPEELEANLSVIVENIPPLVEQAP